MNFYLITLTFFFFYFKFFLVFVCLFFWLSGRPELPYHALWKMFSLQSLEVCLRLSHAGAYFTHLAAFGLHCQLCLIGLQCLWKPQCERERERERGREDLHRTHLVVGRVRCVTARRGGASPPRWSPSLKAQKSCVRRSSASQPASSARIPRVWCLNTATRIDFLREHQSWSTSTCFNLSLADFLFPTLDSSFSSFFFFSIPLLLLFCLRRHSRRGSRATAVVGGGLYKLRYMDTESLPSAAELRVWSQTFLSLALSHSLRAKKENEICWRGWVWLLIHYRKCSEALNVACTNLSPSQFNTSHPDEKQYTVVLYWIRDLAALSSQLNVCIQPQY